MSNVCLITPTGGRPEAFALCEKWMSRQTLRPSRWIVVDDCDPPTRCTLSQEVIRPKVLWRPGDNTQARNLLLALNRIRDLWAPGAVLLVEDDDYYAPGYIQNMVGWLQQAPLVGESHARYYNVTERAYFTCFNHSHSALAHIGFRTTLLGEIVGVVSQNACKMIDMHIWCDTRTKGKLFPREQGPRLSWVGMKGLPGRPGIGGGHKEIWRAPHFGNPPWVDDPNLAALRSWIGGDAEQYARFGRLHTT